MSRQTHHLKRGDTREPLRATLTDRHGDPIPLEDADEIRLQIERPGVPSIDKPVDLQNDGTDGKIIYEWDPEDTEVAGKFRAEVRVEFPDDTLLTFPNDGYFIVDVGSHVS